MRITLSETVFDWTVRKIGVVGPGIVGMPMAALLADARIKIGSDEPARVVVIQRNSRNSGWKVDAINQGRSVIGGIEPGLDEITARCVKEGLLSASHDYDSISDADVVLISIQTDKDGFGPDYKPLFEGLDRLAAALQKRPAGKIPLIVFESTLAPSSMSTLIKSHFEKYGLTEGKDILLGNSPNRVMPGRLVERITLADKLIAGLHPETPRMIHEIYKHIVRKARLHMTNSMTAEVTKTLENAYRDVRIAFSAEIARYCDENNIDFHTLRIEVNKRLQQEDSASANPNEVPCGGILIPMLGVGGHCLPKDGILLWWRKYLAGCDHSNSLILHSRIINDEAPAKSLTHIKKAFGHLNIRKIAVLGAAYRFNSEDTRNSPSLQFALLALKDKFDVIIHDPFVKATDQNLEKLKLTGYFTNDLEIAVSDADCIVLGTAHECYINKPAELIQKANKVKAIYDGCNAFCEPGVVPGHIAYTGIGKGKNEPSQKLVDFTFLSFRLMEIGIANEVYQLCEFLNENYAENDFQQVQFPEVQRLAASCSTGCLIQDTGHVMDVPEYQGFASALVEKAYSAGIQTSTPV